jgi:hypothetical protein
VGEERLVEMNQIDISQFECREYGMCVTVSMLNKKHANKNDFLNLQFDKEFSQGPFP